MQPNGGMTAKEARDTARVCVCAECGGNLLDPWGGSYGVNGYIVRCARDVDHQGVKPRGRETRFINGTEYDVMTQQPVTAIEKQLPDTQEGMVQRMSEAVRLGRFPGKQEPRQLENLAKLALLYNLDPLMGEIMPYQGQPYITVEGRRRIDARAGNHPSIKHRPMDQESRILYEQMGAIDPGDVVVLTTATEPKHGNSVEVIGRVLASEQNADRHLPVVKWTLEMAMKRGEVRARKMLYGPVALPGGMDAEVRLIEEGDIIDAQFRNVAPDQLPVGGDGGENPGPVQGHLEDTAEVTATRTPPEDQSTRDNT